jgi:hypothetical protein
MHDSSTVKTSKSAKLPPQNNLRRTVFRLPILKWNTLSSPSSAGYVHRIYHTRPAASSRCASRADLRSAIPMDVHSGTAVALHCAGFLLSNMSVALQERLVHPVKNCICIAARRTLRTVLIRALIPAVTFRANLTCDLAGTRRTLVSLHVAVLAWTAVVPKDER